MSCLSAPDKQKGFTLIELIVTVTIIVILSAAAIPSFNGYLKQQNLRQAQDQVKNDLRTIQNKALTGALSDLEIGPSNDVPVNYWGVRFEFSSQKYYYFVSTVQSNASPLTLTRACTYYNRDDVSPDYYGELQGEATLPSGIFFRNTTPRCVFFSIKDGSVLYSSLYSHVTLGYVGGSEKCKRVYYNSAGAVYTSNTETAPAQCSQ